MTPHDRAVAIAWALGGKKLPLTAFEFAVRFFPDAKRDIKIIAEGIAEDRAAQAAKREPIA